MIRYLFLLGCVMNVAVFSVTAFAVAEFDCPTEGRFIDPNDCGSFYDCVGNNQEGYVAQKGNCGGRAFDPLYGGCIDLSKAKDCTPVGVNRESRESPVWKALYSDVCNGEVKHTCGNCATVLNCMDDGKVDGYECPQGTFCDIDAGFCRMRELVEQCHCAEPGDVVLEPYSDKYFASCTVDGFRDIYKCPMDMVFYPEDKSCRNPNMVPHCNDMGTFVNPGNCSIYYSCVQTEHHGYFQSIKYCEDSSLFYNEESRECEDPCLWLTPNFKCTEEGRFRDVYNCNQFYECIDFGAAGFQVMHRECPLHFEWSDIAEICVPEAQVECTPEVYENKCTIPDYCTE